MKDLLNILENDGNFFIFDYLTVEIHIWKIIRGKNNQIDSWKLIYANPPALKSWEFDSLDKIKGKTTEEIFGEGATKHYMPVVTKIMDENIPYTFQDYFPNLKKYFRFTSVPIGDYFITTGDDVTEFIEQQQSIQGENEELERLVKERTSKLKTSEEEIHILNIIEKEKEKIYLATMHGVQHITNNLLNELKIVELEIENHPKFDKKVLSMFHDMQTQAMSLMKALSTVDKIDDKTIRSSIYPKNNV